MGFLDNNIHMNGAGTTYQAFLNLADAAAEQDAAEGQEGKIGDRTVRLVKAGDGLATTTFRGTKGARVDQISDARSAFLNAIAREFGYAARTIAEKTLGEAAGMKPVPLTARSIRAVNAALGDKESLAANSALVRENKVNFDTEVGFVLTQLGPRMGATKAELDRGRIQAEALELIEKGQFAKDGGGLREAVREVAAKRVAVAVRLESVLREKGVPEHMVRRLAESAIDEGVAILDDASIPDGEAVSNKLFDLAVKHLANGKEFFDREGAMVAAEFDAKKLISDAFGEDALQAEEAQKALDTLKTRLEQLTDAKCGLDDFKAKCAKAVDATARSYVTRRMGEEMMLENSENPSYGRAGVRLYDALGVGNGPNDRRIDVNYISKLALAEIESRYDVADKGPEGLRSQAFLLVLQNIAVDYAGKLPPLQNEHPHLQTAKLSVALKVAADFGERFANAVTAEDFAKLANDFKAQFSAALDNVNASLKNIDLAMDQAKAELLGQIEQMADQYGFTVTQGIKDMASRLVTESQGSLQNDVTKGDKVLSLDECKATILNRAERKWQAPCRQAAAEIDASALDPAQKKAVLAKIMENKVNAAHVKIVLRTVPAFDAGELANAAKAGDGKKLAEQFYRFVSTTKAMITEKKESEAIQGADEYSSFVGTATDVLFLLHPEIAEGVRDLDAGAREKLFDDAAETSFAKSGEIQRETAEIKDKMEKQRMSDQAKHWSSATACSMQLQQAIAQNE